jgi:hypothetical protein
VISRDQNAGNVYELLITCEGGVGKLGTNKLFKIEQWGFFPPTNVLFMSS